MDMSKRMKQIKEDARTRIAFNRNDKYTRITSNAFSGGGDKTRVGVQAFDAPLKPGRYDAAIDERGNADLTSNQAQFIIATLRLEFGLNDSLTKEEMVLLRKSLGLRQIDFAQKLGYNRNETISEKEAGRVPLTKQDNIICNFLWLASI